MITPTQSILEQTSQTATITDALGRKINLRPIHALDRLRILKAAGPVLSQNEAWLNLAALAYAVAGLDGVPRVPPANETQIETTVSELGDHGLDAIAEHFNAAHEATVLFPGNTEGKA